MRTRLNERGAVRGLVVLGLALVAAACGGGASFDDPRLVEFDDDSVTSGQAHIPLGQTIPYPTVPPYAGPHADATLPCGIYEEEQPFEPIVHTMEHGAVVVYFQPDVFSGDQAAELRQLGAALLRDGARLIVTPNRQIGDPVTLASWGRLLAMDRFEEQTIRDFVAAFENDGPERLPRDLAC